MVSFEIVKECPQLYLIFEHSMSRSRNGGVPNSVGSAEARRLGAKDFLLSTRDTIGPAQYLVLVNHLKALNARTLTIPQLKEGFESVLQEHPILLEKFMAFLPKKFRN